MPDLKETILTRLGVADAMAHRAQQSAQRLQKAAHKHHDAANGEISSLAKQIEAAGVGSDEDAENRYCRALVARAHMAQAGHLAGIDAARMPEVGAHLAKSINTRVSGDLARAIGDRIGIDWANEKFSPADLAEGIEYELERGSDRRGDMEAVARVALSRILRAENIGQRIQEARKSVRSAPAVYLIRHANTGMNSDNPRDEKVRGWTNVPLDASGRKEAKGIGQSAKRLGLRMIVCSDLDRAADTAAAISKATGAPVVLKSEAFRPWNMGSLQGRKVDDVHHRLELYVKRYPEKAVPGGESFDEFRARFLGALSSILEARDDDGLPDLAIVTHSRNLKLAEAWLKDGGQGEEVDGDTYLQRNAPAPGGIVRLTPTKNGWKFERLEEPYLSKAVPETKVKVKIKGEDGAPDVKVKVKIKPGDEEDDDEETGQQPEVELEKGRINRAKLEAAGQGAMSFDEEAHPRAAEGTQGQYKPGEFVPKGEQQGPQEKPDHEKEPWEIPLKDMPSEREMDKRYAANYLDENGNPIASSRTTPPKEDQTPTGTWRKSDYFKGSHGTEVEQLRELDPNDIIPSEDTGPERKADVERYAQWAKEGRQAPPIHVVETDNGHMKVTDGHRRWLAAKKAGTKVRAWVSPAADIPGMVDSQGKPMKTGLTHELAIHGAIEAGHRVPDEVLQDYPELKAKHDQKRKETVRHSAQEAAEDGHPGLAEAHQEVDPKEDWKRNGVRSKAFRSWFRDSKVVDSEGNPKVVYHGSTEKFNQFDPQRAFSNTGRADYGAGFYFSPDREHAQLYAMNQQPGKDVDYGHIYPVYLSIQNPWKSGEPITREEWKRFMSLLPKDGVLRKNPEILEIPDLIVNEGPERLNHKGMLFHTVGATSSPKVVEQALREVQETLQAMGYDGVEGQGEWTEWVAWKPEQIKHVESEKFDPNDPRIKKAVHQPFVPPDVPRWRGEKPSPDSYLPLNGVEDRDKFLGMAREMADGKWEWKVPLVRCGDQLLTGSHRYAAAKAAGVPVETIDAADLFRESGLDFRQVWEEHAQPFTAWMNNMDAALKCLPPDLLRKYGIDLG